MTEVITPLPSQLDTNNQGYQEGYSAQTVYIRNSGVLQIPISEDDLGGDLPCVAVKMSAAWGKKIIVWMASAVGIMPNVPSADPSDPNEILQESETGISEPKVMDDGGTFRIVLTGRYTYILLNPPSEEQGYLSPKAHYSSGEQQATANKTVFKPH